MPLKVRDIEKNLMKKGFRKHDTHHRQFTYYTADGRKTDLLTRLSHSHKEISDNLVALMARQVGLSTRDFRDLAQCPLDQAGYEEKLVSEGILPDDE